MAEALQNLATPLAETTERQTKVKTIRVELGEAGCASTHIIEIGGLGAGAATEQQRFGNVNGIGMIARTSG